MESQSFTFPTRKVTPIEYPLFMLHESTNTRLSFELAQAAANMKLPLHHERLIKAIMELAYVCLACQLDCLGPITKLGLFVRVDDVEPGYLTLFILYGEQMIKKTNKEPKIVHPTIGLTNMFIDRIDQIRNYIENNGTTERSQQGLLLDLLTQLKENKKSSDDGVQSFKDFVRKLESKRKFSAHSMLCTMQKGLLCSELCLKRNLLRELFKRDEALSAQLYRGESVKFMRERTVEALEEALTKYLALVPQSIKIESPFGHSSENFARLEFQKRPIAMEIEHLSSQNLPDSTNIAFELCFGVYENKSLDYKLLLRLTDPEQLMDIITMKCNLLNERERYPANLTVVRCKKVGKEHCCAALQLSNRLSSLRSVLLQILSGIDRLKLTKLLLDHDQDRVFIEARINEEMLNINMINHYQSIFEVFVKSCEKVYQERRENSSKSAGHDRRARN